MLLKKMLLKKMLLKKGYKQMLLKQKKKKKKKKAPRRLNECFCAHWTVSPRLCSTNHDNTQSLSCSFGTARPQRGII